MANGEITSLVSAILFIAAIMLLILIYAQRYKRVPPNKAMVVYGKKSGIQGRRGFLVLDKGGKFINPFVESVQYLPLSAIPVNLHLRNVETDPTFSNDRLNMKISAIVKISSEATIVLAAAEHLLGKTEEEIGQIAADIIQGHVRRVVAVMKPNDVKVDRDEVAYRIYMGADNNLKNLGLEVRSLVLNEVVSKSQI